MTTVHDSGDERERTRFAWFPTRTLEGWVWLTTYRVREQFVRLPGEDGRWQRVSVHR